MREFRKISLFPITQRDRVSAPSPTRYSFSDSNIFGALCAVFSVAAIVLLVLSKKVTAESDATSLQAALVFAFLAAIVTGMWSSLKFANVVMRRRAEDLASCMSWDIYLVKYSKTYATPEEIPDRERSELGTRLGVQNAISAFFPSTDWSKLDWGNCDHEFGSIEFDIGHDDPIESVTLHVRAANVEIVTDIVKLCIRNGWQGIDTSQGDFIERAQDPALGLQKWTAFRNRMIQKG